MRRPLYDWGSRGRCWGFLVGLMGFAWLLGGPASAHPQFALSTVNRYGKLVLVSARQARVFFTLMIGDVPALALRQQADRNGDGTLDAAEQQGLATLLRERVASGVHIYRGEAELPLPWEASPLQLDSPAVAATAFACEISATLPLLGGPKPGGTAETGQGDELRYDDRVDLAPVGEIELRVEEGPGMRVLKVESSLAAPPPAGGVAPPQLLFQWSGPPRSSLSDRSVRIRFAAAGPATAAAARRHPAWYPTRWPWLVGGLLAALAMVAGFRLRRLGRPA